MNVSNAGLLFVVVCLCASSVGASVGVESRTTGPQLSDRAEIAEPTALDDATASQTFGQELGQQLGQQAEQTESEPNDDAQTADQIRPGTGIAGVVSSANDFDLFTLDVEENDVLRANLTRPSGSGLLGLAVYGPSGFVSGVIAAPGETTRYAEQVNQTGQYFLVVASASQFGVDAPEASGTGPYVLDVTTRQFRTDDRDCPFGVCPETTTDETRTTVETTRTTTETGTLTTTPEAGTRTTETGTQTTTEAGTPTATGGTDGVESEPNDDVSSANPLAVGESIAAEISSPTDLDVFALQLSEGETVTIDLARGVGPGVFLYGVTHPNGAIVEVAGVNGSETTTVTVTANQSGTYYVPVLAYREAPGTGQYRLSVASSRVDDPPGLSDRNEPNDDVRSATPLELGSQADGAIAGPADQDWYRFDLSQNAAINATLTRLAGNGTFHITYYYPNGSVLSSTTAESPNSRTTLVADATQAGTYYARVESFDGSGPYRLAVSAFDSQPVDGNDTVSDPNEPNDDPTSATRLQPGERANGTVDDVTDTDVFAVDVREGGTVEFNLTNLGDRGSSLDVSVVGTQGEAIAFDGLPTLSVPPGWWQSLTVSNVTSTGTMYLVVDAGNGTGSYTVSAEVTNESAADGDGGFGNASEREVNDDLGSATPISTETPVSGRVDSASDVDWYSFEAEEGDLLIARLESTAGTLAYGLYQRDGVVLASDDTIPDGDVQVQAIALYAGDYYVRVGAAGGVGSYTLLVRTPGSESARQQLAGANSPVED